MQLVYSRRPSQEWTGRSDGSAAHENAQRHSKDNKLEALRARHADPSKSAYGGFGGWNGTRQQTLALGGGAAMGANSMPVGGMSTQQPPMGRGAAMTQPAWMQNGPPGVNTQQPRPSDSWRYLSA
eukprot:COSAG02_NODE_15147_length_1199_cov_16.244545_2_plen_125_part_00